MTVIISTDIFLQLLGMSPMSGTESFLDISYQALSNDREGGLVLWMAFASSFCQ